MSRARLRLGLGALVLGCAALAFGACSAGPEGGSGVSGGSSNGGSSNGGSSNGGSSNGGSSNGGTFIVDGGGSSNGGSSNGGTTGDACASDNYGGKQLPLDMYLIVDRSGSMQGANWTAVTNAITSFVNSPEADGIGVGLQFFPLVNEPKCPTFLAPCGVCSPGPAGVCEYCDPNGFLPPAVNIAPLPGVSGQIVSAIAGASPGGGTPTMPALQSAGIATTAYAKQHPDRKVIIVLASDGDPSGCNDDINAIAAVAAAARASVPSVSTYAIGIGNIAALNTIAAQGGTGQAIVVDTASGGQDFLDAMNEIRGNALGCEFLMPTPTSGDADPDKLNVRFQPEGGGAEEVFPRVSDATQCQGQAGWYYDNPTDPTQIILCPASCDRVKNIGGEVNIELGCEQIIAPPR